MSLQDILPGLLVGLEEVGEVGITLSDVEGVIQRGELILPILVELLLDCLVNLNSSLICCFLLIVVGQSYSGSSRGLSRPMSLQQMLPILGLESVLPAFP